MLGSVDCLVIRAGDGRTFELLQYGTAQTWRAYREIDWSAWPETNGGYRLDIPPASQWLFDSNGVLTAIRDLWGNSLTLSYTNAFPSNRLTRVDHSGGRYLAFAYTGDRLTGVNTPSANLYARYAYNGSGELTNATVHTSAGDQTTIYSYDGSHHSLTQRINAAGEVFAYTYATNGAGEVTSLCTGMALNDDYYKHAVSYHTNDSYSEVTYYRGAANQVFWNHYSPSMQRITRIAGPGSTNLFTAFTYEPMYLDVTEELTEDNTLSPAEYLRVVRSYDSHHNVTAESAGYRGAVTNTRHFAWHDVYQTPTVITDPEGNTTEIDYTNGLPTTVRLLDGEATAAETRFSYTTNGLLDAVTNANGHGSRFYYDGSGNMTSAIPQAGPAIGFEWSSLGVLKKILLTSAEQDTNTPPNRIPRVTEFTSDELGLVSRIVYPDESYEYFQYDAMRRLTNRIDIAGRSAGITYAPAGHLASVTRYLTTGGSNQAVTTSVDYDQQFNAVAIRDPLDRTVEAYALDLQDRPVAVTNLEGQTMSVNYGLGGFIRSITRFDGSSVSTTYDTAGRLIEIRYPNAVSGFGYLKNDLLTTAANEQGVVSNTYNGANRLTSSTCMAPSGAVAYTYFPAGQVSNVASVAGTVTYALDGADRVESMQTPAGDFSFTFNENNGLVSRISSTINGLNAAFSYDVMDRVTSIVWRDGSNNVLRRFNYGFNEAGLIDSVEREDGARVDYEFDSLDRLTGETQWDAADVPVFDEGIAYDLAGNRTAKTRDGLNVSYSLGSGNRLAGWSVTDTNLGVQCDVMGSANEAIGTGDIFGHLWVSNAAAVKPVAWGTNFVALDFPIGLGRQRIVAAICDVAGNTTYVTSTVFMTIVTNAAYAFSDAGGLTGVVYRGTEYCRTLDLAWDGQYRLTEARTNGAIAERYGHDALGRRAWTWHGTATNWHVYDGAQVVADVNAAGGLVRSYVWGPGIDNLLAMTVYGGTGSTPSVFYAIKDHLGTVHALVDGNGTVVESYRFDAWGRVLGVYDATGSPISESPIGNRYLWQGREYSWKTGLYYFRARWYDPVTGRWLSNDPIGISGGLNQYVFCANDPVNNRDPFGLCTENDNPSYRNREYAFPLLQGAFPEWYDFITDPLNNANNWITENIRIPVNRFLGYKPNPDPNADKWVSYFVNGMSLAMMTQGGAIGGGRVVKLGPDPRAIGPHSVFKSSGGRVTGYTTFNEAGQAVTRFRGVGQPHGGVTPPIIYEARPGKGPGAPLNRARPAMPGELPLGY